MNLKYWYEAKRSQAAKKLRRELQHELWLRKNLKSSKQHWECRKNIFKLRSEIRVELQS